MAELKTLIRDDHKDPAVPLPTAPPPRPA
jgi:hypothetical protein